MIALDTNVLVRWILHDDEAQARLAQSQLENACWIGVTVLLELHWVLQSLGNLPRKTVADALETLIDLPEVSVERRHDIGWALTRYRDGADFADMLHLSSTAKVDRFVTFDRKLAQQAGPDAPIAIEALRA